MKENKDIMHKWRLHLLMAPWNHGANKANSNFEFVLGSTPRAYAMSEIIYR